MAKKETPKQIWFPAKKYGYGWGLPRVWQGWAMLIGSIALGIAPLLYVLTKYTGDSRCQLVLKISATDRCDPDGFKSLYVIASVMWLIAAILLLYSVSTKKGETPKWRWGTSKKGAKHAAKS